MSLPMLSTLPALKSRLALLESDTQYDALLTSALVALSARFDSETNRTLARTVDIQQEFDPADREILAACFPVESVSTFEFKTDESGGWIERIGLRYLIRHGCVISLISQLSLIPTSQPSIARVTYTGGYVLPGTSPEPGQAPLPSDLENAAIEQAAFWFQNRDKLGLKTSWPSGAEYRGFATFDLLPSVTAVLTHYRRMLL